MAKAKVLSVVKIEEKHYGIIASGHAIERMKERKVDTHKVIGNTLALGKEKISELEKNQDEAIIIDKKTNTSIVLGFSKGKITVITVINKSNVFVKSNTTIIKL